MAVEGAGAALGKIFFEHRCNEKNDTYLVQKGHISLQKGHLSQTKREENKRRNDKIKHIPWENPVSIFVPLI